jgi:hypothetical protein
MLCEANIGSPLLMQPEKRNELKWSCFSVSMTEENTLSGIYFIRVVAPYDDSASETTDMQIKSQHGIDANELFSIMNSRSSRVHRENETSSKSFCFSDACFDDIF